MKMLRPARFCLFYLAAAALLANGCNTLPDNATVLHEAAGGPAAPVVNDAQGQTGKRETDRIVDKAAGNAVDDEQLKRLIQAEQAITDEPLVAGNHIELLVDGMAAYKAMFAAIDQARISIHLETYILSDDEVGREFSRRMLARRAAGVEVKVIYDSLGSASTPPEFFDRLRAGGVLVDVFHPIEDGLLAYDQRDHRKLLVVDGRIAFTGGINISNVYSSGSGFRRKKQDLEKNWRDTQVAITGPAAAEFQKLFLHTWNTDQKLTVPPDPADFPRLENQGRDLVRVVESHEGDKRYDIYKAYLAAISLAKDSIWVTQAYFAPSDEFLDALEKAARRGVDVRILLPGFTDHASVLYASHSHYEDLLEAGIKLYERNDRLLHAKTAVIDGVWVTVGSSNLDYRSFLHNNEANAVILGHDFGTQMEKLFLADLTHAQPIDEQAWRNRPVWTKVREKVNGLFDYWF